MKIAYLCLQATTQGQASYAHVHEIIAGLRAAGHEVDLFEPGYAGGPAPGALRRLLEFRRVQKRLAAHLTEYDALYVRAHPLAYPTARRAHDARVPVVQECNGPYSDLTTAWPMMRPFARWFVTRAREQYRRADALVAVTPGLAAWLSKQTRRRDVHVVGNGANTDVFTPHRERPSGLPSRYVVFFGALAPWQGIGPILLARSLPSWPADVELVIIGDGAMRPSVEAADNVIYLGTRPYEEVGAYVAHALASLIVKDDADHATTGLSPLKLYESMAAGVPVIVSDNPGLADTVHEAGCGLVIPPGDADWIARAVAAISVDPDAPTMGANGRAAAVARHSWAARAADTATIIEAAVTKARR